MDPQQPTQQQQQQNGGGGGDTLSAAVAELDKLESLLASGYLSRPFSVDVSKQQQQTNKSTTNEPAAKQTPAPTQAAPSKQQQQTSLQTAQLTQLLQSQVQAHQHQQAAAAAAATAQVPPAAAVAAAAQAPPAAVTQPQPQAPQPQATIQIATQAQVAPTQSQQPQTPQPQAAKPQATQVQVAPTQESQPQAAKPHPTQTPAPQTQAPKPQAIQPQASQTQAPQPQVPQPQAAPAQVTQSSVTPKPQAAPATQPQPQQTKQAAQQQKKQAQPKQNDVKDTSQVPKTQPQPQPQAQATPQVAQPQTQPQSQPQTKPQTKPQNKTQTKPQAQTKPQSQTQPQTTQPQPQAQAQPQTTQPQPQAQQQTTPPQTPPQDNLEEDVQRYDDDDNNNNNNNSKELELLQELEEMEAEVMMLRRKEYLSMSGDMKRNESLLFLERKGLVKEISAKFQTPDTASFTKFNPNTHLSIKERILHLKRENERRSKEVEAIRRETVIQLADEDETSTMDSPTSSLRERIYKSVSEPLAPQDPKKTSPADGHKSTQVATSKSRAADPVSPLLLSTTSTPVTKPSGKGSKIIIRRRRNAAAAASHDQMSMMALTHYLNIPPNPAKPPITSNTASLTQPTKDFIKTLVSLSDTGNDIILDTSLPTPNSSPDAGTAPDIQYTQLRTRAMKAAFNVLFTLPNQTSVIMPCQNTDTIEAIKERLVQYMLKAFCTTTTTTPATSDAANGESSETDESASNPATPPSPPIKIMPENYVIVDYFNKPLEKSMTLTKSEYIMHRRSRGLQPKLKLVEKVNFYDADPSTELSEQSYEIIKQIIPNVKSWHGEEVDYFRRIAARLRYELLPHIKGTVHSSLTERLSPLPLPTPPNNNKFLVSIFLPILQVTRTVEIEINEIADDVIARIFNRNYAKHLPPQVSAGDFILKVMGRSEYIHGTHKITVYEYIRSCLVQSKKIQLVYVQRPTIEMDIAPFKPRFNLSKELPIKHEVGALSHRALPWDHMNHISVRDIKRPFRIKVGGAYNIPTSYLSKEDESISVIVSISLYHGVECISTSSTKLQNILPPSFYATPPASLNATWNENVTFSNLDYANLPMETRLCISLYASTSFKTPTSPTAASSNTELDQQRKESFPIGWVNVMLCDYKSQLRTGPMTLHLWPDDVANPLAPCSSNRQSGVALFIEFEQFALPVVFPSCNNRVTSTRPHTINPKDMVEFFESIIKLDPLSDLPKEKYQHLWALRHYATQYPQLLPRLMLSVPWTQPSAVDEIHALIDKWAILNPYDALELLDAKHVDRKVREYAVRCLESLSEEGLQDILLQLVQVLKCEPYHDSPLARFLLRRSILNRTTGHHFFWYLKSDLHVTNIAERFGLLLESYLLACGTHRNEIQRQIQVIDSLTEVARKIKSLKDQDRRETLMRDLERIEWPKRFQITLNPKFESNGLIIQKSKYMDSKKLPLRLSFTNIDMDAEPIDVIFKVGDDLRQDMLTLQMIRLMDKLWQKEGLDLKLSPYGCIATGDMIGMIEVVLNSETTAKIQKSAGGATAAFKLDPLANWLLNHNKTEQEYQKAVDTFILSCAGYCVATYVLGIGDRHNDNLMCTKLGRLFHIDFGHFLGNYKKKFGFKRERAPFVFTPDFCYVMGGKESPKFAQFVNYCCTAYNILRRHAKLFMNLFAMMVSTGIPELQSMEDLNYLRESFSLELTDDKAREKFTSLIHESLTTKTTQLNNAIHILAH
ncbi:hypothetical protein SAMD00019534_087140 [Acytostelium subglobosum LB1]|uniref:hypothetical protein n=1 Tax=Acytostelium subglobosum LB1 TaxID=1410327 RepID=UPI00064497A4|nr:hypothetical protein SAMD00019534_087140 [Acytostelium subglobosum LB1]GAM25539.1 hypothetical protein SAMD00019534_087140 [Acytostelium subglobosum LB1]|eukprot:XP_012751525.1 hypothetical protein SAMD00019534_087140 [Acytostelium subglobosum LB1]